MDAVLNDLKAVQVGGSNGGTQPHTGSQTRSCAFVLLTNTYHRICLDPTHGPWRARRANTNTTCDTSAQANENGAPCRRARPRRRSSRRCPQQRRRRAHGHFRCGTARRRCVASLRRERQASGRSWLAAPHLLRPSPTRRTPPPCTRRTAPPSLPKWRRQGPHALLDVASDWTQPHTHVPCTVQPARAAGHVSPCSSSITTSRAQKQRRCDEMEARLESARCAQRACVHACYSLSRSTYRSIYHD